MLLELFRQRFDAIFIKEDIPPRLLHFLSDGMGGVIEILTEVADDGTVARLDGAFIVFLVTANAFQERRLARAIRTDQTDAFPASDVKGHIFKDSLDAEGFRQTVDT